jgi:hypothetical protein
MLRPVFRRGSFIILTILSVFFKSKFALLMRQGYNIIKAKRKTMSRKNQGEYPSFPGMFGENRDIGARLQETKNYSKPLRGETFQEDEAEESCQWCQGEGPCGYCKRGKKLISDAKDKEREVFQKKS